MHEKTPGVSPNRRKTGGQCVPQAALPQSVCSSRFDTIAELYYLHETAISNSGAMETLRFLSLYKTCLREAERWISLENVRNW